MYDDIQSQISELAIGLPTHVAASIDVNKILNNVMANRPDVLDEALVNAGSYQDVQFFIDRITSADFDDSNIQKLDELQKDMDNATRKMTVLQTLDSLYMIPGGFEEIIKGANEGLQEQLNQRMIPEGFFPTGNGFVRQVPSVSGGTEMQFLPNYAFFQYKSPGLPEVKDANGKTWNLNDYEALSGENGPSSTELTVMVRLAKNDMEETFRKNTYDPDPNNAVNHEVAFTLADPKATARVQQAATSALQRLYTDPEQALKFSQADDTGKERMIESAKNSGYLVGPTEGGSFGKHHFDQFYAILKLKEKYDEQKAEGETLKNDGFANAMGDVMEVAISGAAFAFGGPVGLAFASQMTDQISKVGKQTTEFFHKNKEVIDTVVEVVAVTAAAAISVGGGLFTGGLSFGAGAAILGGLAAYKAAQGAFEGGVLGAAAGAVSGFSSVTGVGLSYSYEDGFGASVGIEYGALSAGISYSDKNGFGTNASLKLNDSISMGVSYSEGQGFGASISGGMNAGSGALSGSLSYSQNGGFGGNVGYSHTATNGITTSGGLSYNKAQGLGVTAGVSYKKPDEAPKNTGDPYQGNIPNQDQNPSLANRNLMQGTGMNFGYTEKGGFQASLDVMGANAFNWNAATGLTGNANFGVDFYRAQEREKIENKKREDLAKLQQGENEFVENWKKDHPEDADLSSGEIFEKNRKQAIENHETKDGSVENLWDAAKDFFRDRITNYGRQNEHSYLDEKGNFRAKTCFVAGTLVKTETGYKVIETIQIGDIVASANEHTGEISYKRVVQTFIRQTPRIYKLTYNDGTSVETTGDHPFFIQGKGWTNADSLSNGDVSPTWAGVKKSGGILEKEIVFSGQQDTISDRVSGLVIKESLAVVDIEVIEEETTVYNFEVEDDHTYFVTEAEVWVHNADSYTVQKGERVQMVADKFGVSKEALLDANPKAKARGYFLAGEDIDVPASSDPSLADKLLSFGNELKGKWDNFNLEELNPFKKSDPPPIVGDVGIYPIKQENLSVKSVGTQLDNIVESCVLATTTILISNEKGEFIDINDAYVKGNKIGAVVPGKQEQKNGRTTGVNVKDPSALAKSFGVDKNMTIDYVSPGGSEMRKILNEQLQNGKPAAVYFGSSNNLRHMEVVTGTINLGNQTVYKLHDVGYQNDQYLDPSNGRPFKIVDGKWKYSKNKGALRSVDQIWRFK